MAPQGVFPYNTAPSPLAGVRGLPSLNVEADFPAPFGGIEFFPSPTGGANAFNVYKRTIR